MPYTKITLAVVVHDSDSEILEQALNDAMEKIEDQEKVTVYSSEITTAATGEPENAAEIAAKVV
jgi:2-phospho-L-lactate guanylyltransferase (CobY/MobA/RfbA family)